MIFELGQEIYKMSLEYLVVSETKEMFKNRHKDGRMPNR